MSSYERNEYGGFGDFPVARYGQGDTDSFLDTTMEVTHGGLQDLAPTDQPVVRRLEIEPVPYVEEVNSQWRALRGWINPYHFDGV